MKFNLIAMSPVVWNNMDNLSSGPLKIFFLSFKALEQNASSLNESEPLLVSDISQVRINQLSISKTLKVLARYEV